jgi:hypothetical protein
MVNSSFMRVPQPELENFLDFKLTLTCTLADARILRALDRTDDSPPIGFNSLACLEGDTKAILKHTRASFRASHQLFRTTVSRTGRVAAPNPTGRRFTDVRICCQVAENAGKELLFGRGSALLVPPKGSRWPASAWPKTGPPVSRLFLTCSEGVRLEHP